MASQTGTPSVAVPTPPGLKGDGEQIVPFRVATLERSDRLPIISGTITTAQQPQQQVLEGTGYLYSLWLELVATAAGNAAAVTFTEDGPWSALAQIVLEDPTGIIFNLSGFNAYLANIAMGNYAGQTPDNNAEFFSATTGGGATGGSFRIPVHVPAAINRRTLLGLLGNQDRAVKYQLRNDIAPSTAIYGVSPTTLPPYVLNRQMSFYTVPAPQSAAGFRQEVAPRGYGTVQFWTQTVAEAPPQPGSTVQHNIRRIGNTIRNMILVFRAGAGATPRALAQTNVNNIRLTVADAAVFNEAYQYRRLRMFENYGQNWPVGVLDYDFMHDFTAKAGYELGDDWLNTQNVNTAQFEVTYLAGYTAGGSLQILTADLLLGGGAQ